MAYEYFDLGDVLSQMNSVSKRLEVLWAFRDDGYVVKNKDILDYHAYVGNDQVLKELLLLVDGRLEMETIKDLCFLEDELTFSKLLKYASKNLDPLSYDDFISLLHSIDYDDMESYRDLISIYNPDYMDDKRIKEIFNILPYEAYPYVKKFIKLLPGNGRNSIWNDYF